LVIGNTKFVRLKLPAVDLSAIGKACGRKIDGILGVDLLARLGATINLKKQTVHVTTLNEERGADLAAEMHSEMQHCLEAFITSDERAFGDCLDPKIVLFSMETALYGREQVIGYFRERYFHQRTGGTVGDSRERTPTWLAKSVPSSIIAVRAYSPSASASDFLHNSHASPAQPRRARIQS